MVDRSIEEIDKVAMALGKRVLETANGLLCEKRRV
jgi:hypothetical protein